MTVLRFHIQICQEVGNSIRTQAGKFGRLQGLIRWMSVSVTMPDRDRRGMIKLEVVNLFDVGEKKSIMYDIGYLILQISNDVTRMFHSPKYTLVPDWTLRICRRFFLINVWCMYFKCAFYTFQNNYVEYFASILSFQHTAFQVSICTQLKIEYSPPLPQEMSWWKLQLDVIEIGKCSL